jgi:uncharacterized membrane protein YedE/YeeE
MATPVLASLGAELFPNGIASYAVGGPFVGLGVGTRLGKGCTSGHGGCGVGSVSGTSLVNVATFLAVAIGTAQAVHALGAIGGMFLGAYLQGYWRSRQTDRQGTPATAG